MCVDHLAALNMQRRVAGGDFIYYSLLASICLLCATVFNTGEIK